MTETINDPAAKLVMLDQRHRLIMSVVADMPDANHDDIADAVTDHINGLFQEMADDGRLPDYWAKDSEHYYFRYTVEQGMHGYVIKERIQFRDDMPEPALIINL